MSMMQHDGWIGMLFALVLGLVVLLAWWIEQLQNDIRDLQGQTKLLTDAAELAGKNIDWERDGVRRQERER